MVQQSKDQLAKAKAELATAHGEGDLEAAFVRLIEAEEGAAPARPAASLGEAEAAMAAPSPLRRIGVFARREALELRRDPIRLAFALLAPLFLMVCFGFGMSFDVEDLRYAVLDRDRIRAAAPAAIQEVDGIHGRFAAS